MTVTYWPLSTQHLFAYISRSPRRSFQSRMSVILGRADLPSRSELARLRPATRLLIAGLTAWIALVLLATMIAIGSVEMSTMSFSAWLGARASAAPNPEIRPPARFDNILERPLFSRSRQPLPSTTALAPPSPSVMLDRSITLKGVFINGALAKAFLTSSQNPLGVWVRTNEEIAGWRVVAVKPDQVVLDAQSEKFVIPLGTNGGAK
jgi:hypothetical protein